MDQYNPISWMSGAKPVNNPANMMTLSADIHISFDAKSFIFTWKQGCWVSHFLTPTANLGFDHHNRKVNLPSDVHPNFVLGRLAWALFPMIQNFFARGEPRLVRIGLADREMTSHELKDLFSTRTRNSSPAKSRSVSPQKRKRNGADDEDMEASDVVSRRRRLESADDKTATTPDLLVDETPSKCSLSSDCPGGDYGIKLDELDGWEEGIAALRQRALRDQRKKNAGIMCCDYDAAEVAIAAGVRGPRIYGGAQVCQGCLGVEFESEVG
ncbi:hypothetical protein LTR96_011839 [Exophiala xenobiotica]|nr:hypothetical protein LTR72_012310 [Exophiala xenobiotica]KAK5262228.1 hypothetical protein LTR96_011839 [Exophiala xenobiotica]KAK5327115.1 hypothetical protein LTR98_011832 [Exophiala xenobiotica]KAK5446354.1 hypothetical protein LTR55_012271 [Exophiala xenobiotica]